MNRSLIAALAVSAALAVAAGDFIATLADNEKAEAPPEEPAKPRKLPPQDSRPVIDDAVRTKASPTAHEVAESKPGRLRDGGAAAWTFSGLPDGGQERVRITARCRIPNCWTLDGGWDDSAVVDCRAFGPRGTADGGPRWNGCNVLPMAEAIGAACIPTACSIYAGDTFHEVLR